MVVEGWDCLQSSSSKVVFVQISIQCQNVPVKEII